MPQLLLALGILNLVFVVNSFRPVKHPVVLLVPGFFASWIVNELAIHVLVLQVLAVAIVASAGGLESGAGWVGLGLSVVAWAGLVVIVRKGMHADTVVEDALGKGLGAEYRARIEAHPGARLDERLPWKQLFLPFWLRHRDVERIKSIPYRDLEKGRLTLDVYRPRDGRTGCPVLLQIHGGAWMLGSKDEQGRPLMLRLASHGWVCVAINYRLSPKATFPDHLVDVKAGIAWIREHIGEYGGDPGFLAVTGGSAGGHLTAMAALTENDPEYQPGFEDADTSVQAALPFYGVYDFTDRHGQWGRVKFGRFLERVVMKTKMTEDPESFDKASPMSRVHDGLPPFFVVHGALDTLVPVAEARHFVELLREHSNQPVVYAELPAAQHAFEIFPSVRTTHAIRGAERFLWWVVGARDRATT